MKMRMTSPLLALVLASCGASTPQPEPESPEPGSESSDASEGSEAPSEEGPEGEDERRFELNDSDTAAAARGANESKIKATASEAAMKFIVVDKDKGAIPGIVVSMTDPNGKKYFTPETDETGYAEVLVPVGQEYEVVFLSLGRRKIDAKVTVTDEPNQNIKLTLRYKNHIPPGPEAKVVLSGVTFDTGKATIRPESFERLDTVVEYMTHKPGVRIEISGHTDNVGKPAANKSLSQRRAEACRKYLIDKGIDGSRVVAVGYGDEKPVASNEQEEGRQKNRRIEAHEL